MKSLLFFAPLLRPHLRAFALTLTLSLTTLAAGTALLGVSGWFLTATALTAVGISFNLFAPSAAVRGFSFIRILSRYFEKLVGHNATLSLLSDIRRWLFASLFPRLPLPGRQLRHGDLVSRMTADVDALDTLFLVAIGPLVTALIVGGTMTATLFWLLPGAHWIYAGAMAAAALAIPALLIVFTRDLGRQIIDAMASLRVHVLDAVVGHDDIVLFDQQRHVSARFGAAQAELSRLRSRQGLAVALAGGGVQVLTAAALLGTLIVGLAALETNAINGAVLVGLLLAVMGSFEATNVVVRAVGKLGSAFAAADRLKAIATRPPAIVEPVRAIPLPPGSSVCFDHVDFCYDDGVPVLVDFSIDLAAGGHLAITGASGSGKSTVLRLLLRLADPQAGKITVARTEISHVALADLHARIALMSQDSSIFFDTIRNNLTLARPDATDASLWAALAGARLDQTVRALPQGLDTMVGEIGATLSAGQGRRLALARTLLSSADIVVLDEPTQGLDRETELAFFNDMARALEGRTVVCVTHAHIPAEIGLATRRLENGRLTDA
ncbi:thiol reductant ABC exporter subunit CydC [Pelagibacterium montanilacus]|uniref:thiol reductant ABC exporter subunit CydC n=1 Tax=Pelagibacterium montanilacus TaxID=2185280 RepID=UPI000F8DD034|nr:thiol reductant ABC exporter subunit CydC [Pelagibacterium montanilacus]